MDGPFVIVSGLPGSGKTMLGRAIAEALDLRLIDKDAILERLFDQRGTGNAEWRRALSRESDRLFESAAAESDGAVLVFFWRLPGMPDDSGTSTNWIGSLSRTVVNVRCVCPPHVAATRFFERTRHTGHLDSHRAFEEVLASIERQAGLGPLDLEPSLDVDTTATVDAASAAAKVRAMFTH